MAFELSDSDIELPDLSNALLPANHYQVHAISSDSDSDDVPTRPSLVDRLIGKSSGSQLKNAIPAKKSFISVNQTQNKEERKKERVATISQNKDEKKNGRESHKKKTDEEKSRLWQERQEKKEQLEYAKAKKRTLQQAARSAKPGECLKSMLVMVSPGVIAPPMGNLLDVLEKADIRYMVQSQVVENIVTFWREITDVKENGKQLSTEQHEVIEKEILYFLTLSDFLSAVDQFHQALLALQMESEGMVRCVESPEEASSLVKQFTKSVAEAPFKRDRLDGGLATFMDVSGSSKVTKEGRGLLSLWRQHIQQFRNVTAEVANAIIAEYPSPRDLFQAYHSCENQTKAEQLLQDIVVRRGAGVIATNRRIGKELSRKIHLLTTSCDPDLIIK